MKLCTVLWCRHQPRGKPLHRARPAVQPQPAQRPVQHAGWQRLSARVLRAWRGEHGAWCPGYQRDAHPSADLTVDHVLPLAAGGAPFDVANTSVLCRKCNSTKGASTDRGGVAHVARGLRPNWKLGEVARSAVENAERLIEDRQAGKVDAAVKYLTTLSTSAMDRGSRIHGNIESAGCRRRSRGRCRTG